MKFKNTINDEFYTSLNINLIAIENAAVSFVDNCSGHIGMAPQNENSQSANFMEQLIE
jgi:hypothetical protein